MSKLVLQLHCRGLVPYDHQYLLAGCIQRWLGDPNPWHGSTGLYSFSNLQGGRGVNGGIRFPFGAQWQIGCFDANLIKRILERMIEQPDMMAGVRVTSVQLVPEPVFSHQQTYMATSPILLKKKRTDGSWQFITFRHEEANDVLEDSFKRRLSLSGMSDVEPHVKVRFITEGVTSKERLVRIGNIQNKASLCPIEITGPEPAHQLAWSGGIGNSTGMGFGSLNLPY